MDRQWEWVPVAALVGALLALFTSVVFHLMGSKDVAVLILVGGLLSVTVGLVVMELQDVYDE